VSYVQFEFVPQQGVVSFNYIFASNEYGTYQCNFGDIFAFLIKDLDTGEISNLAVVPGTSTPVSVVTVRNSAFNAGCPSVNPQFFASYNLGNPLAPISFRGQTVPLTATANVVPGHHYALKLAVGDYQDSLFDSAVFIQGGSLALGTQCADRITMKAFVDANGDGIWNNGEIPFSHGSFSYDVNGSGTPVLAYSPLGEASVFPENASDSYDIQYQFDPAYAAFYSTAASYNNVSVAAGSGVNTYNFPIVPVSSYADVSVGLTPMSLPRAGYNWVNRIVLTNNGSMPAAGSMVFAADPANAVVSVSDPDAMVSANNVNVACSLQPGETHLADITLSIADIPAVSLGQMLYNTANLSSISGDIDAGNDFAALHLPIVAAYDPNFITEAHGGLISVSHFDASDYLDYTIHFQNVGSAYAGRVKIEETLDEKLDETSIQMVSASHPYVLSRTGASLKWDFDAVALPPQSVSDTGSQGYVHFRIKPKPGYAAGDIIDSFAEIFFDENPAVSTNAAVVEFTDQLGVEHHTDPGFTMYPNPAKTTVTLSARQNITSVRITDMVGKTVRLLRPFAPQETIDLSGILSGLYLVEVTTAGGTTVAKLAH